MTEPSASNFDNPLFARKGLAAPAGLAEGGAGDAEATARRDGKPPFAPDGGSGVEVADRQDPGGEEKASTPPPASLLTCEASIANRREQAARRIPQADDRIEAAAEISGDATAASGREPDARETDPPRPILPPREDRHGWFRHCVAASAVLAGLFAIYWVTRPDPVTEAAGPAIPVETAGETTPDAPALAASQPETGSPVEKTITPTFDIVRVEPDGTAVLAGRAMPDSELIILDNGAPIGTTSADWTGEWVFVPDRPLAGGDHEFSLVIKSEHGNLSLPAKAPPGKTDKNGDQPEEPAAKLDRGEQDTGTPAAPVPTAKPKPPARLGPGHAAADRTYEVQIASLGTAAEAEQEVSRLQKRFPELLAQRKLRVHEAELPDQRRFFRIRTGSFADPLVARALCSEFEIKRQDCLVIRR